MTILSLMNLWYLRIIYSFMSLFDDVIFGEIFVIQKLNNELFKITKYNVGYELPIDYSKIYTSNNINKYFNSRESAVEYLYRKYGENIIIR